MNYLRRLVERAVGQETSAPAARPPSATRRTLGDADADFVEVLLPPASPADAAAVPPPAIPRDHTEPNERAEPRTALPALAPAAAVSPPPGKEAMPLRRDPPAVRSPVPDVARLEPREHATRDVTIVRHETEPAAPVRATMAPAPSSPPPKQPLTPPTLERPIEPVAQTPVRPRAEDPRRSPSRSPAPPRLADVATHLVRPEPLRARETPRPASTQLHIGRIHVEVSPPPLPAAPRAPAAATGPRGALSGSSMLGQRFGLGQL